MRVLLTRSALQAAERVIEDDNRYTPEVATRIRNQIGSGPVQDGYYAYTLIDNTWYNAILAAHGLLELPYA